jgi:hypothetical protein
MRNTENLNADGVPITLKTAEAVDDALPGRMEKPMVVHALDAPELTMLNCPNP